MNEFYMCIFVRLDIWSDLQMALSRPEIEEAFTIRLPCSAPMEPPLEIMEPR